ncbi:hypothetical protein Dimus_006315 [Dionaea muscipula]
MIKFLLQAKQTYRVQKHLPRSFMTTWEEQSICIVLDDVLEYSGGTVDSVNVRITHYSEGLVDEDSRLCSSKQFLLSGEACPSNLEQSGRNIVGKCNGVPLAIKSLGATLRLKKDLQYWKSIENSELCKPPDFQDLPSSTRNKSFAYCSIYGKGAKISKEELIELWMAQGLLFLQRRKWLQDGRNWLQLSASDGEWKLHELGCLCDVRGWLKIGGLEHAKCKEEAQKAEIGAKPGISGLHLAWSFLGRDEDSDIIEKEVLDGLQPHPNLQGFMVEGYNGLSFPSWLARMTVNNLASLDNLAVVRLLDCRRCGHLPTLGQLPVLKTLVIEGMEAVRQIGKEFYTQSEGNGVRNALFPALTTLEIINCRSLRKWLQPESTNPPDVESFPCLEKLKIVGCPLLTIITPTGGFPSLRHLELTEIKSAQRLLHEYGKWSKLTSLSLKDVRELTHLPKEFGEQFTSLETLEIKRCRKLACLPEDLGKLTSLKKLDVWRCPLLKTFPEIGGLRSLIQLGIVGCVELTETPAELDACTSLEVLRIFGCRNLDLKRRLEEERVSGSGEYRIAEWVLRLPRTSLEILVTLCCRNLDLKRRLEEERVSGRGQYYRIAESVLRLPRLRQYGVGGNGIDYENEEEQPDHFVPDISPLLTMKSSLRSLVLHGWPKLKSLPDQLRRFTALEQLGIIQFDGLEEIPEWIGELSSLCRLGIFHCRNLRHLPSRTVMLGMKKLEVISIENCPILAEGCAKDIGPEWDKISHIKHIQVDDQLIQDLD